MRRWIVRQWRLGLGFFAYLVVLRCPLERFPYRLRLWLLYHAGFHLYRGCDPDVIAFVESIANDPEGPIHG